ncbi:MAG: hypothetical protein ACLSFT_02560 [Ruminococcus callidus]
MTATSTWKFHSPPRTTTFLQDAGFAKGLMVVLTVIPVAIMAAGIGI